MENENKKSDDWKRLEFYNEELSLEQEYYWTRFSSFSTLHAGLFVLFSLEKFKHPRLLSCVAIGLGLVWIYVQGASLWYVNRMKPQFGDVANKLEINYPPHFFSWRFFSTTDVALLVPLGLTILWSHILMDSVCIFQIVYEGLLLLCSYFLIISIASTNKSAKAKPTETKQ